MKSFITFFYICFVLFTCLGCGGYCFYIDQPQFGVASLIMFAVLSLNFFKVIELPNKDNLQ